LRYWVTGAARLRGRAEIWVSLVGQSFDRKAKMSQGENQKNRDEFVILHGCKLIWTIQKTLPTNKYLGLNLDYGVPQHGYRVKKPKEDQGQENPQNPQARKYNFIFAAALQNSCLPAKKTKNREGCAANYA